MKSAKPRLSVWSEFIPYDELASRLIEAKTNDVDLFVAFNAKHADYDGFAELLKKAKEAGVTVRPWLLLDEKDGYWFNKWNVAKNAAFAKRFVDEMESRGAKPDWITFDLEPPQTLVASLQAAFDKRQFGKALRALSVAARSASLSKATQEIRTLVDELHSRGIKVHAVTTNFVLDDGKSGKIQNALGTPVAGIPYDEVSFMIYRPELEKILGPGLSSKIVEIYAKRAKSKFGARAAIDIGERQPSRVGAAIEGEGFEFRAEPGAVALDVELEVQTQAARIPVG